MPGEAGDLIAKNERQCRFSLRFYWWGLSSSLSDFIVESAGVQCVTCSRRSSQGPYKLTERAKVHGTRWNASKAAGKISPWSHSLTSSKGHGIWGKFLMTGKMQMSQIPSRRIRKWIQGTTVCSASTLVTRKIMEPVLPETLSGCMKYKKVMGSSQHVLDRARCTWLSFSDQMTSGVGERKSMNIFLILILERPSVVSLQPNQRDVGRKTG